MHAIIQPADGRRLFRRRADPCRAARAMTGRGSVAGDFAIRGRAPFPEKILSRRFRDFDEWFADHAWASLSADLCRHRLPHRPAAASARPPHLLRARRLDVLDRRSPRPTPATMADSRAGCGLRRPRSQRIDANLRAVARSFAQCGIPSAICQSRRTSRASTASISSAADAGAPATRLDALMPGAERAGARR